MNAQARLQASAARRRHAGGRAVVVEAGGAEQPAGAAAPPPPGAPSLAPGATTNFEEAVATADGWLAARGQYGAARCL